eukprot:scaffold170769_cov28-Tisochrysis_lutea.AAC.7
MRSGRHSPLHPTRFRSCPPNPTRPIPYQTGQLSPFHPRIEWFPARRRPFRSAIRSLRWIVSTNSVRSLSLDMWSSAPAEHDRSNLSATSNLALAYASPSAKYSSGSATMLTARAPLAVLRTVNFIAEAAAAADFRAREVVAKLLDEKGTSPKSRADGKI